MTAYCISCDKECASVDESEHCPDCVEIANEDAYERQLEDYYGGDSPPTLREQMAEARKLK